MASTDSRPGGLGTAPTQGWHCEVPGLVVLFRGTQLRLTHLDSGTYLAAFPTLDAARGAADALAGLCDWTLPLDELHLDGDAVEFITHVVDVYQGGDVSPEGDLPPFEFFWSEGSDLLPPTDSEAAVAVPGWSVGVDGLAVAFVASQLRLVHVVSGRAVASFPTLESARATAPFLLPLVAPHGWVRPYEKMAGDRSLWTGVAAAVAVAGGGDSVLPHGELPDPELRCQVLRPAWSTCDEQLAVVLTAGSLYLTERATGEVLDVAFTQLGEARSAAAKLAGELASAGLSAASWASQWRDLNGMELPLGPRNPRG